MDLRQYYAIPGEKPLDRIPADGGFAGIFRKIVCIGDSLSSGEFESLDRENKRGYHDMYEYSWGQYLARLIGSEVYNFSRGGMTAKEYCQTFADANHFWDQDKVCPCYIIALGCNDILNNRMPLGSVADINPDDYTKNNEATFAGWYGRILQRYRTMEPKARFFLVTLPREENSEKAVLCKQHAELLHQFSDYFDYTYVIDLFQYGPVYDREFRRNFYLGGHLNPAGYLLTSRMIASYMDFIIRNCPEDFAQVGFIGKPYYNMGAKW